MQQVVAAELAGEKRVFTLVLGPVNTRAAESAGPGWVTPEQVGDVAVAVSAAAVGGREIRLTNQAEVTEALALVRASTGTPVALDTPSATP
jgi:3-oxoacyl-[acyl-carrier protein] reductase